MDLLAAAVVVGWAAGGGCGGVADPRELFVEGVAFANGVLWSVINVAITAYLLRRAARPQAK